MGILHINGVQVLLNEQLSQNKKKARFPKELTRIPSGLLEFGGDEDQSACENGNHTSKKFRLR